MSDMDNYLGNEIGKAVSGTIPGSGHLKAIGLRNVNIEQQKQISQLQNQVSDLKRQLSKEQEKNKEYEKLLSKPMEVIASKDRNFKKTYEEHTELIANWMVSQKAFKELAIEFGFEQGLTKDEVIEMGNSKKLDVVDNKNNIEHGTNAKDGEFLQSMAPKVKEQLLSKKSK